MPFRVAMPVIRAVGDALINPRREGTTIQPAIWTSFSGLLVRAGCVLLHAFGPTRFLGETNNSVAIIRDPHTYVKREFANSNGGHVESDHAEKETASRYQRVLRQARKEGW